MYFTKIQHLPNIIYIHQLLDELLSENHQFMTNLVDCDLKYGQIAYGRTAIKQDLDLYFNKIQYQTKYYVNLSIM